MTPELEAFKAYVATIPTTGPDHIIARMLGEAKSLHADACISLPCVRAAVKQNRLLEEGLTKISKVSLKKGIDILKDLGLWKPTVVTDRRD